MMVIKISVLVQAGHQALVLSAGVGRWEIHNNTSQPSTPHLPTSFSVFICGNFNKVNFLVPHHLSFGS